jgi:hypothetical protein
VVAGAIQTLQIECTGRSRDAAVVLDSIASAIASVTGADDRTGDAASADAAGAGAKLAVL